MHVKVRVYAGRKREGFTTTSENRFEISVKEPAEQNLANRRVAELVARHFKVSPKKVHLMSGHRSPSKIFSVDC
jgi:uncharacterized protein YggU (UPF0235/DUF167 family)